MTTSSSVELGAEDGTSRRRTSVHNNQSSTLAPETIDGLNIARARLARCDLELEEIEDKERKIIQIHVIGRILFTVLSLSLLWMCSLPVINYIVDLVLVHPPSDELSRDWGALIDVGVSQTSSYKTCLQEEHNRCLESLTQGREQLHASYVRMEANINQTVNLAQSKSTDCQLTYTSILDAFSAHQREGGPIYMDPMCSAAERTSTMNLIRSEAGSLVSTFRNSLLDLRHNLETTLRDFPERLSKRIDYDEDYIFGKNISALHMRYAFDSFFMSKLDQLPTAFFPVASYLDTISCNKVCQIGFFDQVTMLLDGYNAVLLDIARRKTFIQGIVDRYVSNINSLEAGFAVIADVKEVLKFFSIFDIGYTPPPYSIPRFPEVTLPKVDLSPRIDSTKIFEKMRGSMTRVGDVFVRHVNELITRFHIMVSEIKQNMTQIHVTLPTLNNYQPPAIVYPDMLNASLSANSFTPRIESHLSEILFTENSLPVFHAKTPDMGIFSSLSLNTSSVAFANPKLTLLQKEVSIDSLRRAFNQLLLLATLCDIVYRSFSTIQTILGHLQKSNVPIPSLDISKADTEEKNTEWILKLPMMLVRPIIVVCIIIMLAVVGFHYAVKNYAALYEDYMQGCVNSQSGTRISRMLSSIFATSILSQTVPLRSTYEASYIANQNSVCSSVGSPFLSSFAKSSQNYLEAHKRVEELSDKLKLIGTCVDGASYSGALSSFLLSPESILNVTHEECSISGLPKLDPVDASGECASYLPNCARTCESPDASLLNDVALYTSCNTEKLGHAKVLRSALRILLLLCLNLSRILLTQSLAVMYWSPLTGKKVLVKSDCRSEGSRLPQQDQQARVQALHDAMKQERKIAFVKLLVALLIHIPYLSVIFMLREFSANLRQ